MDRAYSPWGCKESDRAERLTLSGFLISLSSSRSWAMLVYFTGVVCGGI